jgi:MarR family transcriptional regulator, transcriptional regulator for hemolysin
MPADRRPQEPGNPGARTAWVAGSVGPQLRIAAKSARMLLERRLAQAGASFATWTVLAMLESAGPVIQRVLAASLGIEGPTLTRHLGRLEELGLIRRNRDGADRRYALVELTPSGRMLCHELDAIARAANDQLLSGFSEAETAQLKSMLQKLTRNASENSQDRIEPDGRPTEFPDTL